MAFVQLIEFLTDKPDEVAGIDAEWFDATEGKRTLRRSVVARDRKNPQRHIVLAFFDSYESAMENSELPETKAFSERYAAIVTSPVVFHDLDIIEDRS
jgi:hypothetical protein